MGAFLTPGKSLVFVTMFTLSACSSQEDASSARPASERDVGVVLHEVEMGQDFLSIEAVGTARARQAAEIYPETSGEVEEIAFVAGERVQKGDVLARLDSRMERLAVERAEVTLKNAQQLLTRFERIDVPEAVSESQIDEARSSVEGARIDLELAQEALAERTIRAPFSGYTGLTNIDPGARITTSTVITELDDRSVLFIDFDVPEQVFGRITEGMTIPVSPFSGNQQPVEAEVLTVGARIDPDRRTFQIRMALDNDDDRFRPGMSFRMTLTIPGESYPQVPEASISWGGDGPYLWKVENGEARRIAATIIRRKEGVVLLKAPLQDGDQIVAEGVQKMREGMKVRNVGQASGAAERPALADSRDEVSVDGASQ